MLHIKTFIYISILVFTVSCSKNNNSLSESRTFEFTYQVSLEPLSKS